MTAMPQDQLAVWLDARAGLKAQAAEIAEQLDAVEGTIKDLLGDTEAATAGRWRITYRHTSTTRVDAKKVKAILEPLGLLEKVQTTSESRALRITEVTE